MKSIKLFMSVLVLCFLSLMTGQVFADDCQIDIPDTGVKVDVLSVKKVKEGFKVKLNYNNTSDVNYEITGVNVATCQHDGGELGLPEMSWLAGGQDHLDQNYICTSSFNKNEVHVKLYMKEKGQEAAVAACDVVKARK